GFKTFVARRYKHFSSRSKPLYAFSVSAMAGRQTPFKPVVFERGGLLRLKRGDFDCILNLHTGRGSLKAAPRIQAFDSFLRTFYSWLLPHRKGLLIHGAGIARGGRAFLFPGVSGAGKSTLSKLAASVPSGNPAARRPGSITVLTDELIPVRREGKGFYVYGSPFWGEMKPGGENRRFPLAGVFRIIKSPENSLRPLEKGVLLRLLLRCAMNFSKERRAAAAVLSLAAELASEKNAGELRFSKSGPAFLDLL
ncbi:MAG: hypothetical protein COT18_04995, partial [Elusimicrobia bacterium CG08_land_8_20_14_0_20_59_10]